MFHGYSIRFWCGLQVLPIVNSERPVYHIAQISKQGFRHRRTPPLHLPKSKAHYAAGTVPFQQVHPLTVGRLLERLQAILPRSLLGRKDILVILWAARERFQRVALRIKSIVLPCSRHGRTKREQFFRKDFLNRLGIHPLPTGNGWMPAPLEHCLRRSARSVSRPRRNICPLVRTALPFL